MARIATYPRNIEEIPGRMSLVDMKGGSILQYPLVVILQLGNHSMISSGSTFRALATLFNVSPEQDLPQRIPDIVTLDSPVSSAS